MWSDKSTLPLLPKPHLEWTLRDADPAPCNGHIVLQRLDWGVRHGERPVLVVLDVRFDRVALLVSDQDSDWSLSAARGLGVNGELGALVEFQAVLCKTWAVGFDLRGSFKSQIVNFIRFFLLKQILRRTCTHILLQISLLICFKALDTIGNYSKYLLAENLTW